MNEIQVVQQDPWRPTLGATVTPEGVRFEVWAPAARQVAVVIETPAGRQRSHLNEDGEDGIFAGLVPGLAAGARYWFQLDDGALLPDPCSRSQPDGPHGASEVVDPDAFIWTDASWPGLSRDGLVLYELHVGTFTPDGTFDAAIERLPYLRELGVTAIELMPLAAFPGRRGWGYDGVNLFAPHAAYGGPEALRRLVDAAHAQGLGVLLDVVYNHLGPDGNYLRAFSPDYFTDRHQTPWGDAFNYDGANSHRVRELIVSNAWRWVREFHIDGLRLDAVHTIHDSSPWHILADLAARARTAAHPRGVVVIAESDANDVTLLRSPLEDGHGLDGVWSDDFHHAVRVLLTGQREGYYAAFQGLTHEIAQAANEGFIYQGQPLPHSGVPRGTRVTDEPAAAFVFCIQNHDQVGNRALGERLNALVSPAAYRAASALLLLVPETPLLFMGQEFAASTPFLFFTDHEPELGRSVTEGRRAEFAGFSAFTDPAVREQIPDPQAEATFLASKLDWSEAERNADTLSLYRNLLALRASDPVLAVQDRATTLATAVSPSVVAVHRWAEAGHRLLLVNFGEETEVDLDSVLAPHAARDGWRPRWHSNALGYGGDGTEPSVTDGSVRVPATTAVLLERDA